VDESGDLGWDFTAPYRGGGSSRYLTIAALCVPPEKKKIPKRLIKDLYKRFKWNSKQEKKWFHMEANERTAFASSVQEMAAKHPDICLHAIVVYKPNVMQHIRGDSNKLYNYMTKLSLVNQMAGHDVVTLVPDPRSIKVKSGNSLHDYIQTELWFVSEVPTVLSTCPLDSRNCAGIQFADMLSGLVQARFQDNSAADFQVVNACLALRRLYFP